MERHLNTCILKEFVGSIRRESRGISGEPTGISGESRGIRGESWGISGESRAGY